MNETIKEFLVGLGFNIDEAGLRNFTSSITNASLSAAALGAAVVAASAAIVGGVSSVAKGFDDLDQLAQKYNTTASSIDDFVDSASMVGIGGEAAESALASMNKVVGEAALGIGRGKVVLEKLGIQAVDTAGKVRPVTDVMSDLQNKLAGLQRGQAMTIMEKLGLDPQLLRLFNGELGDIAKIQDEMSKNDVSVGFDFDNAIKESKAFQKSMIAMKTQANLTWHFFTTLWESLAVKIMPKVREGVERLGRAFEDIRRKFQDNGAQIVSAIAPILDVIIRVSSSFLQLFGRLIGVVSSVLGRIFDGLSRINDATDGWAGYLAAALIAWRVFNLGFLATPLGAILGLSVAILALYDDFMTAQEGGESLFDWAGGIKFVKDSFNDLLKSIEPILNVITALYDMFVGLFTLDFGTFANGANTAANGIIGTFNLITDVIANLISVIADLLGVDITPFANAFKDAFDDISKSIEAMIGYIEDSIASIPSISEAYDSVFGSPSLSAPTPQTQAAIGATASINQSTNITVNGSTNPNETASAIASKQSGVNSSLSRNLKGATR